MKLKIDFMEKRLIHYGQFRGCMVLFVKLSGCNLRCKNCEGYITNITGVKELMKNIIQSGVSKVVFSGGEPLIQDAIYEVVYELVKRGLNVLIESNGTIPLEDTLYQRSFKFRLNLRVPSKGTEKRNNLDNFKSLLSVDEVNFDIKDIIDYNYAKSIMKSECTKAQFVMTIDSSNPIAGLIEQWILEDGLVNIKLDYKYENEMED